MTKRQWVIVQQAMLYYRNTATAVSATWNDVEDGPRPAAAEIDETVVALDFALKGEIEGD